MSKPKRDEQTGLMERSIKIEDMLELKNIGSWGKPRGIDIFKRSYPMVEYAARQREQEMWLYNRRMLTGPSTEVLAMD